MISSLCRSAEVGPSHLVRRSRIRATLKVERVIPTSSLLQLLQRAKPTIAYNCSQ